METYTKSDSFKEDWVWNRERERWVLLFSP
ncbi:unnamed protein product, partial [Linum tenue]